MAIQSKQSKGLGISFFLSVGTLLIIFVSILVLSGKFSSLVTGIVRPHATMAIPQVNQGFSDPFKAGGEPNPGKWTTFVTNKDMVQVFETPSDNLRMQIKAGATGGSYNGGGVTFNQSIADGADFRVLGVVYMPIVTGDVGSAVTGIRFASNENDKVNAESTSIRWIVRKDKANKIDQSFVIFTVLDNQGKSIYTKQADIKSNVAVFRIIRVHEAYRAGFQLGSDASSDASTVWLTDSDVSDGKKLGQDGRISLFTTNNGTKDHYASVVGRFDSASIQWQDLKLTPTPNTKDTFSDAFSNDQILKTVWKIQTSGQNATITANQANNLALTLLGGTSPDSASLWRTTPDVPKGKDFMMNAYVYKPKVIGTGNAVTGILFAEPKFVPAGTAKIQWVYSADAKTNKLQFILMGNDRVWHVKAETPVTNAKQMAITLSLRRIDGKYAGWYRFGDSDADWKQLGISESEPFDAIGNMILFASNTKGTEKFPFVNVQIDTASGWVSK